MTTTITPPKAQIPIGTVTINGVRYEVEQHPEIVRFFFDLVRRAGGSAASSNTELGADVQSVIVGEMVNQPAQAGAVSAETIQQALPDVAMADVMQSSGGDPLGVEMTWQRT